MYLFKNKDGKVLYVGKAKNLRKRVSSYFDSRPKDAKTARLVQEITSVEHIVVYSEVEAFLLEANLIKKYRPFFNISLKDDKFYPYIEIGLSQKGSIPYVSLTRKTNNAHAAYFGPYTSAESARTVLKILRRIFPFQSVRNHPMRNCLYYHLKLCPCMPAHPEKFEEYKKNIEKIRKFLNGEKSVVLKMLESEQKAAIKQEEFEKAADLQKKIDRIHFITSAHFEPFTYMEKPDFYYERLAKETDSLKSILYNHGLKLKKLERIECYDISNFQGRAATGSMVTFVNGESAKQFYRKFRIKTKNTPDDFHMHQEMMKRRLNHLDDWGEPDLLVIDGGKGQVSSVLEVLVREGKEYPVIGLAKREETIVIPVRSKLGNYTPAYVKNLRGKEIIRNMGKLELLEVTLPKSTPGVNLLRRIRDEAHRFAITYHRLLREKKSIPARF